MTSDPGAATEIARDLSEQEAMALVDYLRECGITAHPGGTHVAALYTSFRPGFGAHVIVKQSDARRARQAVEEFRRR